MPLTDRVTYESKAPRTSAIWWRVVRAALYANARRLTPFPAKESILKYEYRRFKISLLAHEREINVICAMSAPNNYIFSKCVLLMSLLNRHILNEYKNTIILKERICS